MYKSLNNNGGNSSGDVENLLRNIERKDTRFSYKIALDEDGSCYGSIWQTDTMRKNWEKYGDVIFLGSAKRQ